MKTPSQQQPLPDWLKAKRLPYIIAEAGVNHNGSLRRAKQMIQHAKLAGADAVKFQAFTAEELCHKQADKAGYQQATGPAGQSQLEMLQQLELSVDDFSELKMYCEQGGMDFLATPFSSRWVSVLSQLGMSMFKVGSGSLTSPAILEALAKTVRPVLLSTGMASLEEIDRALEILRQGGCEEMALLHCVSLYPAPPEEVHLHFIPTLAEHTRLPVGFSDHTEDTLTGALAVAAGAVILEKHFTLDKTLPGPDHAMSLQPEQLRQYIDLARRAGLYCGSWNKVISVEEEHIKQVVRTSLVTCQAIKAGQSITADMLTEKRPGSGICPIDRNKVLGSTSAVDMPADHIIQWSDIQ